MPSRTPPAAILCLAWTTGRSDTIKNTSDTINGTINQRREVVNGSNEPVNEPLNESDSPPSLLDGTINGTINPSDGTIKQRLFSVIIQTEGLKRESLASRLSVSLRTVARLLAELENDGKIIYSGSKKTGGYYAVK